jgi:hypothetical protein
MKRSQNTVTDLALCSLSLMNSFTPGYSAFDPLDCVSCGIVRRGGFQANSPAFDQSTHSW